MVRTCTLTETADLRAAVPAQAAPDRHRYPDQQVPPCPLCSCPLTVRQGPRGPAFRCGCQPRP